jgi:predicted TPR repeat methyltransferase
VDIDDPGWVGDVWADVYDERTRATIGGRVTTQTVDILADLAPDRRILELGVGTGRIALPLAERGFDVHGIDASEKMVAKLHDKPGGSAISVSIGDFADVDVDGSFGLIAVVFNTFYGLASQDEQVRCVANVAARLTDRGVFVVEGSVPDVARFTDGTALRTARVAHDQVWLVASTHDPVDQVIDATQIVLTS